MRPKSWLHSPLQALRYQSTLSDECIFTVGDKNAPQIFFIQPFFEESNRLRRLIASIMRQVADAGFCAIMPDLPGTGESLIPLETISLTDWKGSAKAAGTQLDRLVTIASFRTGALIDTDVGVESVWRFAPETGQRMVRDLLRTRLAGSQDGQQDGDLVTLAGNVMQQSLLDALSETMPREAAHCRTVRLQTEAAAADIKIAGSPLWRRSEPGDDPEMAALLSADLISWAKTCVVF